MASCAQDVEEEDAQKQETEQEERSNQDTEEDETDGSLAAEAESFAGIPGAGDTEEWACETEIDSCSYIRNSSFTGIGVIEEVSFSEFTFWNEEDDFMEIEECDGDDLIARTPQITITVLDSYFGDTEGTFTVQIPVEESGVWPQSYFIINDDGEAEIADDNGVLDPGDKIGVMAFEVEDDVYSTLNAPLFSFDDDSGEMRTSSRQLKCDKRDFTEQTVGTVDQVVSECETADLGDEVQQFRAEWDAKAQDDPRQTHGTLCSAPYDPFPSYCTTDDDCESEEEDGGTECDMEAGRCK